MDLAQQALAAREEGLAEVYRLLQQPEDLERLPELIHEYENKAKANQQGLSALMQSQVEAVRAGLELLDKSHRHVLKLRGCLDSIFKLCEECASLIDQRDRISLLSQTHGNVQKVLTEIKDIIDLPSHAELALEMLQEPAGLVAAYQALTVLEGTAENAKLAWKRNAKAVKHDMSSLMRYLQRVSDAAADFEVVLFENLEQYEELAQEQPTLLVDCLRVIEMQERLDKQYVRARMENFKPKRWRQRMTDIIRDSVSHKFKPLLDLAPLCGQPNKKIKYNQEGDVVVDEKRDYLGNLVGLKLLDKMTGREELVTDAVQLRRMEIIEEETFEEDQFLNAIIPELYGVEADLADVYDHVTLCFPPSYNIFETLFQMYHIHVAMVIDTMGQQAEQLSTGGSLRIMEFVRKYLDTLRGFGLEEALVRLPPSPTTNPDLPPGLDNLMRCYIERMETSVTKWFNNIMVVDLEYEPKPGPSGKLRTAGVTDFFRILNEEIDVIRAIDDHGDVMFQTARMSLRIMGGFQREQTRVIKDPDNVLSLEMFCALLNNNVECYDQSLTFVEEVQELLEEEYRDKLEVEDVCRGFLEVAKEASKRLVGVVFNDPGMSTQLKNMFSLGEWVSGRTTSVLLATITDYMGDIEKFVEDSFIKRVAESMLEELVRRCVNIFIAGIPPMSDAIARRMESDEDAFITYFGKYLKSDKLVKPMQQLSDLRLLVSSDSVSTVVAAYESALSVHSGFTLEVLQKILDTRGTYGGWDRKQLRDVLNAAKEVYKKHDLALAAAEKAAKAAELGQGKGFFSFWSS